MVCFGVQGYIFISRRFGLVEFLSLELCSKKEQIQELVAWRGDVFIIFFRVWAVVNFP